MWQIEIFVLSYIVRLKSGSVAVQPKKNCIIYHVGTIMAICAKSKYYFDLDKTKITLQTSGNEEVCHFPVLIEKISRTSASLV